jgi:hypothetical protein
VKRAILQSLVSEGAGDRIVDVARSEKDPDLRRAAIRDLGAMSSDKTGDTLRAMYTSESSVETKHDIADALYVQRNAAALVALARAEKDPGLKKDIVSRLSTMRSKEATDYMLELLK